MIAIILLSAYHEIEPPDPLARASRLMKGAMSFFMAPDKMI